MRAYSTREVADLLGEHPARIRSFARAQFVSPRKTPSGHYRFSFQDLVMLRAAKELTEAKLDRRRLWRALRALRKQLPSDRPLSSVRVLAEGDRVLVREQNTAWEAESGQTIMDFAVTTLAEKVAPLVHESAPQAKESATTGDEWFDIGLEFDQIGARKDARAAYAEALNLNPDHVNARINLGRLLHNDRAYNRAEKLYREALRIDPANSIAAFNLGVVLEDQGAIVEALETYQHALSVDPTIPDVHYNLARLYEHQGNREAAQHHFSRFRVLRDQHEN
ncbi:MAG: tetratricopeptide repeat protein [Candidatus Rariloculaceae bacterium]